MAGSGVYIHLPQVGADDIRMRYPIAPVYHEGSFEYGAMMAMREEQRQAAVAQLSATIDLQHRLMGR